LEGAIETLDALERGQEKRLEIVFLDASDEALLRRYSSTRRPHPLSTTGEDRGAQAVGDGLHRERELLAAFRARATIVARVTATGWAGPIPVAWLRTRFNWNRAAASGGTTYSQSGPQPVWMP